jgi:pimeloyl-ACP methyl ester carboxylesterase
MRLRSLGLLVALLFCFAIPARAEVWNATTVDGRLGPGALYRLVKPDTWNGSLIVYVHGYVSTAEPVALPEEADLIANLVAFRGFAIAYSSFSENGWAVKDGVQRTQQLLGAFKSKFGSPSRVYIAGVSMGALIAIELVEKHPGWFDGMLTACAVTSSRLQADYMANVRALFDVFYPGALPGDAASVPAGTNPAVVAALAFAAMTASQTGAVAIAGIAQTPVPFSNGTELANSIATAVGGNAAFTYDLLPELHGKNYFDNSTVVYTGAPPPPPYTLAFINTAVHRYDAAPSASNYLEQHYEPNGALQIPTVMFSTARDPVVPQFHRTAYENLVEAAGQLDFLVVKTPIDHYGHCDQTLIPQIAAAFFDLVAWVEFGVRPTP